MKFVNIDSGEKFFDYAPREIFAIRMILNMTPGKISKIIS